MFIDAGMSLLMLWCGVWLHDFIAFIIRDVRIQKELESFSG